MTTPQSITSEIQKLAPSAVIELFVLDVSALSGTANDLLRFHAGTNGIAQRLVWQGNTYQPFPIMVEGFELNGQGQLPRPKIKVANVTGIITVLVLTHQDLIGAKLTRKRTLAKYLDAVNFPGGSNPSADATAEFADDVFYIDRKARETREVIEFELAASFDLEGVQLPRRQVVQNVCTWRYRSAECSYTGTQYFDANDQPVTTADRDVCGKRLSSCKVRFSTLVGSSIVVLPLPYGGFPGAGLFR